MSLLKSPRLTRSFFGNSSVLFGYLGLSARMPENTFRTLLDGKVPGVPARWGTRLVVSLRFLTRTGRRTARARTPTLLRARTTPSGRDLGRIEALGEGLRLLYGAPMITFRLAKETEA